MFSQFVYTMNPTMPATIRKTINFATGLFKAFLIRWESEARGIFSCRLRRILSFSDSRTPMVSFRSMLASCHSSNVLLISIPESEANPSREMVRFTVVRTD